MVPPTPKDAVGKNAKEKQKRPQAQNHASTSLSKTGGCWKDILTPLLIAGWEGSGFSALSLTLVLPLPPPWPATSTAAAIAKGGGREGCSFLPFDRSPLLAEQPTLARERIPLGEA